MPSVEHLPSEASSSEELTKTDEPPMFIERPSSARSQDVTHILVRTFRDLFTRDTIAPDTVQYLSTSRCSDDDFHQQYVEALLKVQLEHEARLQEVAMLERHIMQAQARSLSADEREANRLYSGLKDSHPDLYVPPVRNHFRSCIDAQLLKKHNLISPDDFSDVCIPPVPPPAGPDTPHYALCLKTPRQFSPPKPPLTLARLDDMVVHKPARLDDMVVHKPAESEAGDERPRSWHGTRSREKSLPKLELLWKQQVSREKRQKQRSDLSRLQDKVNYLKTSTFVPTESECVDGTRHTLTKPDTKLPKELGIKQTSTRPSDEVQIFVALPSVVKFTDYRPGHVYELTVEFRNVSVVSRSLRVIPPQTTHFAVGLGQFPASHGQVAPGMSCQFRVRFVPDSLCDYDDVLIVESLSTSPLYVPLQGRRQPPILTLPEHIDVGECLIGAIKIGQFTVNSHGGSGRFCLVPRSDWPNVSSKSLVTTGAVQLDEMFEVKPVLFEVSPKHPAMIHVLFAPQRVGDFHKELTIVCDNCHVRHVTVSGKGVQPNVELVAVEGGLADREIGEICDISAQHLLRFMGLNPFTYTQRTIAIRNNVQVELPFYWIVVKSHCHVFDPDNHDHVVVPKERMQDIDSAFSVDPENGILGPGATASFVVTFAPALVQHYQASLHLVLRYMVQTESTAVAAATAAADGMLSDHWAVKSLMPSTSEPSVCEVTVVELEVKGDSEQYNVTVEPPIVIIPGQLFQDTVVKRKFMMCNTSHAPVGFTWTNSAGWFILHVEPTVGELQPNMEVEFDLSVSASQPGKIEHDLLCHIDHVDEPLSLHVSASVKCNEVTVDEGEINFGLVRFGESVTRSITVRNPGRVPILCSIRQSPDHEDEHTEFTFTPDELDILPLTSSIILVTFRPQVCRRLKTVLELLGKDGCFTVLSALAEVQLPQVCLLQSVVNFDAFINVRDSKTVVLFNQTLVSAKFEWGTPEGPGAEQVEVEMVPQSGVVCPREEVKVSMNITPRQLGEISCLVVPCLVEGMTSPVYLSVTATVRDLSVTYSVCSDLNDSDTRLTGEGVTMDFGSECTLGNVQTHYLRIRNNSGITAPYRISMENFPAAEPIVPTPPAKKALNANNSSRPKALLQPTANLADPSIKTPAKAAADQCRSMLRDDRGIAFHLSPARGTLQAFDEAVIEVTLYSDMWGSYTDRLVCNVGHLDTVFIPVSATIVGSPVRFQMVMHNPALMPAVRFGDVVDGAEPMTRRARIMNLSPAAVRVDWVTFSVDADDRQLIDLVAMFGKPFPLKDHNGNEIMSDCMAKLTYTSPQDSGFSLITSQDSSLDALVQKMHESEQTVSWVGSVTSSPEKVMTSHVFSATETDADQSQNSVLEITSSAVLPEFVLETSSAKLPLTVVETSNTAIAAGSTQQRSAHGAGTALASTNNISVKGSSRIVTPIFYGESSSQKLSTLSKVESVMVETSFQKLVKRRPKLISLTIREHGGHETKSPFIIKPSQFMIAARGSEYVNVIFTPHLPVDSTPASDLTRDAGADYASYGLGYLTLADRDHEVKDQLYRPHQYDTSPLRLELSAHIRPASVHIEYHDDEEMTFTIPASKLLDTDSPALKSHELFVHGATLCNTCPTQLNFRLVSTSPFNIVYLDPRTGKPSHRVNRTDVISLEPRQNVVIHVAFCFTPDLLNYLYSLQYLDGRSPDGVEMTKLDNETQLNFAASLNVEFVNRSVQKVPVSATVILPSFKLSVEDIDFGTCFVGQTREMHVLLSNTSSSGSRWECRTESQSANCIADTFTINPSSGILDAQTSFLSNNKQMLSVYFTASNCENYEAVYVIEGILGEDPRTLRVRGNGSFDGRFEAIVNI